MAKVSIVKWITNKIKQAMAIVQDGDTATRTISSGKYVLWNNNMYTANSNIASGDALSSKLTACTDGGLNELSANTTQAIANLSAKVFDMSAAAENLTLAEPTKTSVTHYHVVEQGNIVTVIGRIAITGQIQSGSQTIVRGYPKPKYNVYCAHNNLDFSMMMTDNGDITTGSNFPGKSSGNFIYTVTYYSDNLW